MSREPCSSWAAHPGTLTSIPSATGHTRTCGAQVTTGCSRSCPCDPAAPASAAESAESSLQLSQQKHRRCRAVPLGKRALHPGGNSHKRTLANEAVAAVRCSYQSHVICGQTVIPVQRQHGGDQTRNQPRRHSVMGDVTGDGTGEGTGEVKAVLVPQSPQDWIYRAGL